MFFFFYRITHVVDSPLISSSSNVVFESVDSLTFEPSSFLFIILLLEKFLVANIVVRIAPYNDTLK